MRLLRLLCLTAASLADSAPKEAIQAFEKGLAAIKSQHPDDAIADFRQAVTLAPRYAEAWFELGKLQLQTNPTAARQAFNAAIEADPNYADPYFPLAAMEYAASRWKELADITGRLLQNDAIDYPQAWLLHAAGLSNTQDLTGAERSLREAERLDPEAHFPSSWSLLGQILARRGDFADAAEQFRAYLKAAPSSSDVPAIRAKLAEAEAHSSSAAGEPAEPTVTFGSQVTLALVPFRYLPPKDAAGTELHREDIEIREDGAPREPAVFSRLGAGAGGSIPVEISLLFDCSSSVDRVGLFDPKVFRETLLDASPGTSIAIYGFSDELLRFAKPTRDPAILKRAMDQISILPARGTPLFGSIADTMRDTAGGGPSSIRLLIVFSDGESESPGDEMRNEEAVKAAARSGTAIFPVILNKAGSGSFDSAESVSEFAKLADETGGKLLHAAMGTDVLHAILGAVSLELMNEYVAGYYMTAPGKPRQHGVKVILKRGVRGKLTGGSRIL